MAKTKAKRVGPDIESKPAPRMTAAAQRDMLAAMLAEERQRGVELATQLREEQAERDNIKVQFEQLRRQLHEMSDEVLRAQSQATSSILNLVFDTMREMTICPIPRGAALFTINDSELDSLASILRRRVAREIERKQQATARQQKQVFTNTNTLSWTGPSSWTANSIYVGQPTYVAAPAPADIEALAQELTEFAPQIDALAQELNELAPRPEGEQQ